MDQFTFQGKQKSVLLGFMGLGLACLIMTFFMDSTPHHTRFWSNLLHNSVFFTGIAFTSLFAIAACISAYAAWFTLFKRIWEAYAQFLIVGLVLMSIIIAGLWGHLHHLYHWNAEGVTEVGSATYDTLLAGKAGFLNKVWYTLGTFVIVGAWYFFAVRLRKLSLQEDKEGTGEYNIHRTMKKYAAAFLPIAAFTSAALIWLWTMSLEPHWYSTMYAWYTTASWWVSAVALTILSLIYLKSLGYFPNITDEHMHDLGKFLFAFSIFWTYLWFSQFMLIWYANVGEETVYFQLRRDQFPVLFYGNLIINFALPFLILLRNDTKRKYGTLGLVAILVLFGHWWDFFYMIKPGLLNEMAHAQGHHGPLPFTAGFTIPGLLEIGIFLGFLAGFIYFFFAQLTKGSLEPKRDPYYGESVYHHS